MQHNRQTDRNTTLMIRPKRSRLDIVSVRAVVSLTAIIGTNDGLGMARDAALGLKTVESVAIDERRRVSSTRFENNEKNDE